MSAFNYQAILDTYKALLNKANEANETRYQAILANINSTADKVGSTYDTIGELISTIGTSDRLRIQQTKEQDLASSEQDLISRGLGNTTIRGSAQQDIGTRAEQANQALSEQIAGQQANLLGQRANFEERIGQLLTQTMENRTDQGPDLGLMAQLMAQAGAGAGAADAQNQKITNTRVNSAALNAPMWGQPGSGAGGGGSGGGGGGGSLGGFGGLGGGGGSGGGGSTSAFVIRGSGSSAPNTGASGGSSGGGGAATVTGGSGQSTVLGSAGQAGSNFDNLFVGQQVYGDAPNGVMGTYAGGGQMTDQSMLDFQGNLQSGRVNDATGGKGQGSSGGGKTITIKNTYKPYDTKTISVPAAALGNGPGGLKNEATYAALVPWGYQIVK